MNEPITDIKYFSDAGDDLNLISDIEKINPGKINCISYPADYITITDNQIAIIRISGLGSEILKKINFTFLENLEDSIFIIPKDNAPLAGFLVRKGIKNIFALPLEFSEFKIYLQNLIDKKNSLASSIDFNENNELLNSSFKDVVGTSKEIKKIIDFAQKVSENKYLNILILGETGTGKGLLARAIHKYSNKDKAPFVDIVCTAIPENLMESELFGYEKGAFTNAIVQKIGLFEVANNGTLLLDEIGDLSPSIQAKLLRVIDKKIIRRLGGINDISVNSRIISATNRNLEMMIENKLFRRDLYHRLNVVSIELPPLRYRTEDIIPLAYHFIDKFNKMFGKEILEIDNDFKEFILNYSWPGNIREFRNTIERSILLCEEKRLKLKDFLNFNSIPDNLSKYQENTLFFPHLIRFDVNFKKTDIRMLNKLYAKKVLMKMRGNKSKTSKILNISRPKLDSLLN